MSAYLCLAVPFALLCTALAALSGVGLLGVFAVYTLSGSLAVTAGAAATALRSDAA